MILKTSRVVDYECCWNKDDDFAIVIIMMQENDQEKAVQDLETSLVETNQLIEAFLKEVEIQKIRFSLNIPNKKHE
jgi:hypothetical protein